MLTPQYILPIHSELVVDLFAGGGGLMKPGIALEQTCTGNPDFPGGEVVTMSPGGPGRLVECMKCEKCGWSVR